MALQRRIYLEHGLCNGTYKKMVCGDPPETKAGSAVLTQKGTPRIRVNLVTGERVP